MSNQKTNPSRPAQFAAQRRSALKCIVTWAGSGVVWSLVGGVPRASAAPAGRGTASSKGGEFKFVQISDSHVGFNKQANSEPMKTLAIAIERANLAQPSLVLHTGDITHLSKVEEFDAAAPLDEEDFSVGEHSELHRFGEFVGQNGFYEAR